MKKHYVLFFLVLLLASCSKTTKEGEVFVSSISLSQASAEMLVGETIQLKATILPGNATDKTTTWASSRQSVATVSEKGDVTAVSAGESTITASAGGKSATCKITVENGTVSVTSITLDKTEYKLNINDEIVLVATVSPDNATDKTVSWSSSDARVASVSQTGRVKGLAEGAASIVASAGGKTAICQITVSKSVIPVASVALDRISVTLEEKQTTRLVATVSPGDATDKTVTWSSSDSAVATVDQTGLVTAVKEGSATITAKAGEKSAECSVTVQKEVIPVSAVSISRSVLQMTKGQTETLTATVSPDNATDKTVTWSSSDVTIVSIDQNGKLEALKGGSATITAKAGEKSATCSVTVTVPVEDVSLDRTSLTLEEAQTTTLVATVSPADATDKEVAWSTSDSAVATVDQNGKVTAVKEGSATITAKAGDKLATCSVTVSKAVIAVTSVTLDKTRLEMTVGATETLKATVSPDNATDKTVTWTSSDATVVSVDQSGKVKALKGGAVTITAKAGEQSATADVDVFEVKPNAVEVKGEGEDFDVTVITTRPYHLSSLPDWVKEKSVENQVHHFTAEASDTAEERSGVISFCSDEGSCLPCVVTQKGNKVLKVSPETLSFEMAGGSQEVAVTSTLEWTASSSASWCTVSPASGSGSGTLSVKAESYEQQGSRSATVTLKAGDIERTVSVEQEGIVPFAVSPTLVDLGSEGGYFDVTVTSSYGYHLTGTPEWISETGVSGKVHTFLAEANAVEEDRSGVVTFCDDQGACLSVFVRQAAHEAGPDEVDWDKEFYHRSLFMRFTATWCGWCPRMASSVKLAQSQNPGKIEAISLHGSGSNLYFSTGSTLENQYGITGFPTGVMDGWKKVSNYSTDVTAGIISDALQAREAAFSTATAVGWTSSFSGQKLTLETYVFCKEAGDYKYTVLLVEDGIVGYQADYENGAHDEYHHDGVVRMALSSISGETISATTDRTVTTKKFTATLPSSYVKENMRIVVYVQRAYGSLSPIEGADFTDYFVDNCATGKAGNDHCPAVVSSAGGGNEDLGNGNPVNW